MVFKTEGIQQCLLLLPVVWRHCHCQTHQLQTSLLLFPKYALVILCLEEQKKLLLLTSNFYSLPLPIQYANMPLTRQWLLFLSPHTLTSPLLLSILLQTEEKCNQISCVGNIPLPLNQSIVQLAWCMCVFVVHFSVLPLKHQLLASARGSFTGLDAPMRWWFISTEPLFLSLSEKYHCSHRATLLTPSLSKLLLSNEQTLRTSIWILCLFLNG